jgi:hypothetical protein
MPTTHNATRDETERFLLVLSFVYWTNDFCCYGIAAGVSVYQYYVLEKKKKKKKKKKHLKGRNNSPSYLSTYLPYLS